MTDGTDIARKIEALQDLLSVKFGVRRGPLPRMLARTGRRLPPRLRAKAAVLSEAQARAEHPKLARQVDHARVARAFDEVSAHLRAIDVADRRKGRILGIAAAIAFNIIVIAAAFVWWLWWRGYV